jgi:hypothetical protein
MSRVPLVRNLDRRDHRTRRLGVEPLEDRRLLAVMSFQDGVLPTPDYAGTRDVSLFGAEEEMNFGDEVTLRADAEQGSTGFPVWSLLKWDLSGIPAEATINDVSIVVNVTNTTVSPGFDLFAMRTGWIEDQATWIGPTSTSTWEEPGVTDPADFNPTVLGTMTGTATGPLSVLLNSAGRAVVAGWLADPTSNHGLLLSNPANDNSLRFDSREATTVANRPKLSIDFTFNDVESPTATLIEPLDNGPADEDDDAGEVLVGVRDSFVIGLDDFALDDATVTAETLTISKDAAPFSGFAFAFEPATNLITITPTAGSFAEGSYTVTLSGGEAKIADATGNAMPSTVLTIVIDAGLPTTPVAFNDDYQTAEDTPLTVDPDEGVLDNDFGGNAPGDAVLVSGPSNGTLELNPDGSFTYTPSDDFHGQDSFTYTLVTPLFTSNVATATIDVTSVPDPPIARNDEYRTPTGTLLEVSLSEGVLANDTSVEGGALTVRVDVGPQHGTLELSTDGSLSYTPTAGFSGTDIFTYIANDGAADSLATEVTLIVNDPPTTAPDEYQVDQGGVLTVPVETGVLSNDSDAAGEVLTAELFSGPSSGELVLNSDGSLTYTPEPDFLGSDSFTYRAVDPFGATTPATVTINVVGLAPVVKGESYTGLEDETLTVDAAAGVLANDVDPQGDAMTAVLTRDVREGSLTLNPDGSFTYAPNKDFVGQDSFRYRATDGQHESASTLVQITIENVNDPPVAVDDEYVVAADGTFATRARYERLIQGSDPLGYWRLGENSGATTAVDLAGENHGDYRNFSGSDLEQVGAIVDDKDTSVHFDGVDNHIQLPGGFSDFSKGFSVEVWAYPTAATSWARFIDLGNGPLADNIIFARDHTTSSIYFSARIGDSKNPPTVTAPGAIELNKWQHFAAVLLPGGDVRLYKNGEIIASGNTTMPRNITRSQNFIGKSNWTQDAFYRGRMDEVAIYDHPLSAVEIQHHYRVSIGELDFVSEEVLVNDTDVEGDSLQAVLVEGVKSGTLALSDDGSFSYVPDDGFIGIDTFTYIASDGQATSNVATVTIRVNAPPIATDDEYEANDNTSLVVEPQFGLLSNDTDADPLSAVLVSGPVSGTLELSADGSFTYTPNLNFIGTDTFTYLADDGHLQSNPATVTISVVGMAPVATVESYTGLEDETLTVDAAAGVLANDVDPQGDEMTAVLTRDVREGSLVLNPDGSFTYTPNENFVGQDSFRYKASDGQHESEDIFVGLTVENVNDPPVAVDDEYVVIQGDTLGGIGDFPPGVQLFEWTENGHFYGIVTDSGSWAAARDKAAALTFRDTPGHLLTVNSEGENDFVVENILSLAGSTQRVLIGLSDHVSEGSFRWVTGEPLTYTNWDQGEPNGSGNNDFIEYSRATGRGWHWNDTWTGGGKYIVEFEPPPRISVLDNDIDLEGDVLEVILVDDVQHGTLSLEDKGMFMYVPDESFAGIDVFRYVASDGEAASNVATVTIQVNGAPVTEDDDYDVAEDEVLVVDAATGVLANDADPNGDAMTAVLVSGPAHGSVELAVDGSFTYTPQADFFGDDTFTYRASDGTIESDVATVTIEVDAVGDVPVAVDDVYTVAAGERLVVAESYAEIVLTDKPVGYWRLGEQPGSSQALGEINGLHGQYVGSVALGQSGAITADEDTSTRFAPNGQPKQVNLGNPAELQITGLITMEAWIKPENIQGGIRNILAKGWVPTQEIAFKFENGAYVVGPWNGTSAARGTSAPIPPEDLNNWVHLVGLYDGTHWRLYRNGVEFAASESSLGAIEVNADWTIGARSGGNERLFEGSIDEVAIYDRALAADEIADHYRFGSRRLNSLLANDLEVDNESLVAQLSGDVESGALELNEDGSFTYAPVENFVGVDRFTYRASDGENLSNLATVTIEVGPQSEAIVAGDDAYSVSQDETLIVSGNVIAESGLNDAAGIGSDGIVGSPYAIGESVHLKGGGEVGWNGETWQVNVGGGDFGHDRARVVTSQVIEGDAAMFLDGASLGTWVHRQLPAEQSGRLRIEQHVRFTDLAGSFTSRPFGASATSAEIGPQWTAENGQILVRDGDGLGGGAMIDTGFRWQPGQWHQVSLDIDVVAQTYELSFDGQTYTSPNPLGFRGSPTSIREISYLSDKDAWIDRVRILSLEESDLPSVLANDTNAAGDVLQTILVDGPENGDLKLNPDGTFVYTPLAGLAASDQFTYRATNGVWVSNLATVTINNESSLPADLTGNGFVDFQDLTILLANWNQNVSAAEGNLVDAGGTPVNFQDLTVLLAAWTGPGGAASPAAALATPVGRRLAAAQETMANVGAELEGDAEREAPRQAAAYGSATGVASYIGRRASQRSRSASGTYGRLQAAAVDRALEDDSADETFRHRSGKLRRRAL